MSRAARSAGCARVTGVGRRGSGGWLAVHASTRHGLPCLPGACCRRRQDSVQLPPSSPGRTLPQLPDTLNHTHTGSEAAGEGSGQPRESPRPLTKWKRACRSLAVTSST